MMTLGKKSSQQWAKVVTELKAKEAELQARVQTIQQERKACQLEASLGNLQARGRLAQLTADMNNTKSQLEDVQGALEQAQAKLEEARAIEEKKRNLKRAEKIEQAISRYQQKCREVDTALASLKVLSDSYLQAADEINELIPDMALGIRQNLRSNSLLTVALAFHTGKNFPLAPPMARSPLVEAGTRVVERIRKHAEALRN